MKTFVTGATGFIGPAPRAFSDAFLSWRVLSEFRPIFSGNRIDLFSRELFWRYTGWCAGVTEKAVQPGRSHNPE